MRSLIDYHYHGYDLPNLLLNLILVVRLCRFEFFGWSGLVCLVWFGLVWFGLVVWFGSFGLVALVRQVWFGLVGTGCPKKNYT